MTSSYLFCWVLDVASGVANDGAASGNRQQVESDSATDSGNDEDLDDMDMDSFQTHCKCPCGSTSLLHCAKPPPACLARRYSNPRGFPELDVTIGADRKKARHAMRQHLSVETERIRVAFNAYGMAVYRYAKSVTGISSHLKQMLRLDSQAYTDLTTFDEIYNTVTKGTDFLNFEPLKRVLDECNHINRNEQEVNRAAAMRAQSLYEGVFKKFAQLRVFSFVDGLRELRPPIQEGTYDKLKVKIEECFRKFIVDRFYHFKQVIREVLGIPERVFLRVTDVKGGCIEITFEIIGNISDRVFELDIEKKRALASNNISMLEYAGKVHYCCCNLFSDEVLSQMLLFIAALTLFVCTYVGI